MAKRSLSQRNDTVVRRLPVRSFGFSAVRFPPPPLQHPIHKRGCAHRSSRTPRPVSPGTILGPCRPEKWRVPDCHAPSPGKPPRHIQCARLGPFLRHLRARTTPPSTPQCKDYRTDPFPPVAAACVKAPLIAECHANLECKVFDGKLVAKYNFFVLEVVKAWIDPSRKHPRTIHHQGEGVFMVAGRAINLPSKITSRARK